MSTGIFVIQDNDRLLEMEEQAYETEDVFQALLADHPGIIPGSQIDSANPRRWLLICREAAIPGEADTGGRWSLDHLLVDQDAIPTLVEVKRSEDTRIRREVVGQMLEYAANAAAYWSSETIRAWFEAKCSTDCIDAETRLQEFIDGEQETEDFWATLQTNLDSANLRLVFLADRIPAELQTIVEFLNRQMEHMEVLAVEVKRYGREDTTALVSRVLGQTASKKSSRKSRQWEEDSFFAELSKHCGPDEVQVARRICDWSKARAATLEWGEGRKIGGMTPVFESRDTTYKLVTVWTNGNIEVLFEGLKTKPVSCDAGLRLEIVRKLNAIPGISIADAAIDGRPNHAISVLCQDTQLEQFLDVLDWCVCRIVGSDECKTAR